METHRIEIVEEPDEDIEIDYHEFGFGNNLMEQDQSNGFEFEEENPEDAEAENSRNTIELQVGSSFACDKCKKNFENLTNLVNHIHSNHRKITNPPDSDPNSITKNKTEELSIEINAEDSNLVNDNEEDLLPPILSPQIYNTNEQNNIEIPILTDSMASNTQQSSHQNPLSCATCGKVFRSASGLEGHIRLHTGDKPFSCDICGKGFTLNASLFYHKQSQHQKLKFSCKYCKKTFPNRFTLQSHTRKHTGETPFSCQFCYTKFKYRSALVRHVEIHHQTETMNSQIQYSYKANQTPSPVSSVDSNESPASPESLELINSPKGPEVEIAEIESEPEVEVTEDLLNACHSCPREFKDVVKLTAHLNTHVVNIAHLCNVCGQSYAYSTGLSRHRKDKGHYEDNTVAVNKKIVSSPTTRKYPTSSNGFIRLQHQPETLQVNGNSIIANCSRRLKSPGPGLGNNQMSNAEIVQAQASTSQPNPAPYPCNYCERGFLTQIALKSHEIKHEKISNLRHTQLKNEASVIKRSPLKIQALVLGGPPTAQSNGPSPKPAVEIPDSSDPRARPRLSPSAPAQVKDTISTNNINHSNNTVNGNRRSILKSPLKRPVANEQQSTNASKKVVNSIQSNNNNNFDTEEEDYWKNFVRETRCWICKQEFHETEKFREHFQQVHTKLRLHACDYCGRKLPSICRLREHVLLHTGEKPHKCPYCSKVFRLKKTCKAHERVHTGEKPFKCEICNQTFTQSTSLKFHRRIHTGEKPYQCDSCDAAFTNGQALRNHKKNRHGLS